MSGPLTGIKVVELSTFVAAPSAARLLADLGAEVIKIESVNGDPWRATGKNITNRGDEENPIFDVYNIGKKSICINIKEESGLDCVFRLLEDADVFITNTRAKSLKKSGLDAESLLMRFPTLIFATIDGFGAKGPDANSPGFDNVAFWTRSGFLLDMSVESEGSYPVFPPTGGGDSITGNTLATGIFAALFNRERTGRGDVVSVSLYNTAIWAMSSMVIRAQKKYGEQFPKQRGEMNPLTTQYKCADGNWFCITVLEYDRYAAKVYELLGIADAVKKIGVTDYRSMKAKSAQMIPLMEKGFLMKPLAEWTSLFAHADIVSGAMTHLRDVTEDEQAWANGFIEQYRFRNGESCVLPATPIWLASQKRAPSLSAPMPGEQTDALLRGAGYSDAEIQRLHDCGAVK